MAFAGTHRALLASHLPPWLPRAGGVAPTVYADFANNRYWYSGHTYSDFGSWLSALGGTFSRASTAIYTNSAGLLATAASGALRFDYNPTTLAAKGILLEGARTNIVLWDRDLTNAVWTQSNVTAALDQTGADGSANSASSLTATAGNGTVLQSVTTGSTQRVPAAYVKRITGSGNIDMTMDGGTTWTTISGSINSSTYTKVTIAAQTLANPSIGFRIVTNGDKVAVDYVDNEAGAFSSSPIATTTVSVTRAADSLLFNNAVFVNDPWSALIVFSAPVNAGVFGGSAGAPTLFIDGAFHGAASIRLVTNLAVTANTFSINTRTKLAGGFHTGASTLVMNGGTVATNATAFSVSGTSSALFYDQVASAPQFGTAEQIAIWNNLKLSNAELQRLTT